MTIVKTRERESSLVLWTHLSFSPSCLCSLQSPRGALLLLLELGAPLTTVYAQLVFECGTGPLSLGSSPPPPLPCFLVDVARSLVLNALKPQGADSREPMPKRSGMQCSSRPAKMWRVGTRDPPPICTNFTLFPGPIGCMGEVEQSGQPFHH